MTFEKKFSGLTIAVFAALFLVLSGCIQPSPSPTPTATPSPENVFRNALYSCVTDEDCALVNKELGLSCCYAGTCQEIDYSEEKWIAVNSIWLRLSQEQKCPSKEECGPAPLCAVRIKNNDFQAKCDAGICKKKFISPSPSPVPQGFSIQTKSACDSSQNSNASIFFTSPNDFTATVFARGSACAQYAIDSVSTTYVELAPTPDFPYGAVMSIGLKDSTPPETICIQCFGISTITIKGKITEPLSRIGFSLSEESLAFFNFAGIQCGGIAGFSCPLGFACSLEGKYPDAGGKCVAVSAVYTPHTG